MGFVDKLRSARTLGYTNPNIDIDSMFRGIINDEHNANRQEFNDRRFGGFLSGGGGSSNSGGGYLNRGGGFNNRGGFTNPQPMNVVYDQRPEMATKELNLKKQAMAQDAKLEEAKMALLASKQNDEYIDNRRANELKQKQVETQDWAARNMKPGEMSDKDKLEMQFGNQTNLQNLKDAADTKQLEMSLEGKKQAEIEQSMNDWVKTNSRNRIDTENNTRTTEASKASAAARALSTENAARIRMNQEPVGTASTAEIVPGNDNAAAKELLKPGAPQINDMARKEAAAQVYGQNNVPMVGGIGSAALGTNVGQLGVPAGGIGNGKLDPHTGQLLNPQDSKNSGFVDMVDPNGRPLKVPANEVDALLKKGAKRR